MHCPYRADRRDIGTTQRQLRHHGHVQVSDTWSCWQETVVVAERRALRRRPELGAGLDDYMRDRRVEALAGVGDDPALEPVRTTLRVRRDDDLVRAERAQRILDRLQRGGVAGLAPRRHAP